jgi:hypothetical protein
MLKKERTMSNGYATEDLEAILESLEADEADEADEAVGRTRRGFSSRPPTTASGKSLVPAKPQTGFVTEARLQAALARVGEQIKTNSEAIKTVNNKISTISAVQERHSATLKKETEERKKDIAGLASQAQLLALLPLLQAPKTVKLNNAVDSLPAGTNVLVDGGDSLNTLLPLLLVSGSGSGTGLGLGGGGASTGSLGGLDPLLLVLLLSRK